MKNFALRLTAVAALAALMWVVRIRSRVYVFNVGRDVEFDLRNEIIEKVHQLGPSFFRRMPTGEIMSRATNDLGQLRLLVGFGALAAFWADSRRGSRPREHLPALILNHLLSRLSPIHCRFAIIAGIRCCAIENRRLKDVDVDII